MNCRVNSCKAFWQSGTLDHDAGKMHLVPTGPSPVSMPSRVRLEAMAACCASSSADSTAGSCASPAADRFTSSRANASWVARGSCLDWPKSTSPAQAPPPPPHVPSGGCCLRCNALVAAPASCGESADQAGAGCGGTVLEAAMVMVGPASLTNMASVRHQDVARVAVSLEEPWAQYHASVSL